MRSACDADVEQPAFGVYSFFAACPLRLAVLAACMNPVRQCSRCLRHRYCCGTGLHQAVPAPAQTGVPHCHEGA